MQQKKQPFVIHFFARPCARSMGAPHTEANLLALSLLISKCWVLWYITAATAAIAAWFVVAQMLQARITAIAAVVVFPSLSIDHNGKVRLQLPLLLLCRCSCCYCCCCCCYCCCCCCCCCYAVNTMLLLRLMLLLLLSSLLLSLLLLLLLLLLLCCCCRYHLFPNAILKQQQHQQQYIYAKREGR